MAASRNVTKQVATDFEKIIHDARDRKKNEALAAKIFNKDRRSSTPLNGPSSSTGSLASRAGVKKTQQRGGASVKPRHSTGDINGEWVHDLHDSHDARLSSLASRITTPNLGLSANRPSRRAKQVAQALIRTEFNQPAPRLVDATVPAVPKTPLNHGLTIRGLAGPFVCLAQNFAPGTTAADIESAMTPVCGIINRCRIIKTQPIVIAEVTFPNKEGADRAVDAFDGQTADGRVIKVYLKPGNQETPDSQLPGFQAPSEPRSMRSDGVIDGSMGFDDPMETDRSFANGGNGRRPPRGPASESNNLYSDDMMRSSRRGRGFSRDRSY